MLNEHYRTGLRVLHHPIADVRGQSENEVFPSVIRHQANERVLRSRAIGQCALEEAVGIHGRQVQCDVGTVIREQVRLHRPKKHLLTGSSLSSRVT